VNRKRRDDLRKALALLPTHRGVVVRKTPMLSDLDLGRYTPGRRVKEPFFVSSSLEEIPWKGAALRWEIESATGHKIRQFSRKAHQNEVLFNVDREFEVLFNGVESGQRVIRLKEMDR
jgi:hypothetical protein